MGKCVQADLEKSLLWAAILGPRGGATGTLGRRKADLDPLARMGGGLLMGGVLGGDSPLLRLAPHGLPFTWQKEFTILKNNRPLARN